MRMGTDWWDDPKAASAVHKKAEKAWFAFTEPTQVLNQATAYEGSAMIPEDTGNHGLSSNDETYGQAVRRAAHDPADVGAEPLPGTAALEEAAATQELEKAAAAEERRGLAAVEVGSREIPCTQHTRTWQH